MALGTSPDRLVVGAALGKWATWTGPVLVRCRTGERFILKAPRVAQPGIARSLANELVVGTLGEALGAPIPPVAVVTLPWPVVYGNPLCSGMVPGPAFGSLEVPNARFGHVSDIDWADPRMAGAAVLFELCGGVCSQMVRGRDGHPWLIDTGEVLPAKTSWTAEMLALAPAVGSRSWPCNPGRGDALDALSALADEVIAAAVAAPPAEWGVTLEERSALAVHLSTRRDIMLAAHSPRHSPKPRTYCGCFASPASRVDSPYERHVSDFLASKRRERSIRPQALDIFGRISATTPASIFPRHASQQAPV